MPSTIYYISDFENTLSSILNAYRSNPTTILIAGGSILPLFANIEIDHLWTFYLSDERYSSPYNIDDASKYIKGFIRNPSDCAGIKIDLAILGIGEDGHIASLFPNHASLCSDEACIIIDDSPKMPRRRVSVGLSVVNSVGRLVFMVPRKNGVVKGVRGPHESIDKRIVKDYEVYLDDELRQ